MSEDAAAHDAWALELLARRAREDDASPGDEGLDDSSELMALVARHGGRCWYCGCVLTLPAGDASVKTQATRDHVIPHSKGGSGGPANLVAACRACNNAKRTKTVEEYRTKLGAGTLFYGEIAP